MLTIIWMWPLFWFKPTRGRHFLFICLWGIYAFWWMCVFQGLVVISDLELCYLLYMIKFHKAVLKKYLRFQLHYLHIQTGPYSKHFMGFWKLFFYFNAFWPVFFKKKRKSPIYLPTVLLGQTTVNNFIYFALSCIFQ